MALGVAETCNINEMTDEKCREEILARGHELNPMKGIIGIFYREHRQADLQQLCLEILSQKNRKV